LNETKALRVKVDGGTKNNPGPSAWGVCIFDRNGNPLEKAGERMGHATNNEAEYQALIEGCKLALPHNPAQVTFLSDSQLVVRQIKGIYKTREPRLKKLRERALILLDQFPQWQLNHIGRGGNHCPHSMAERAFSQSSPAEDGKAKRKPSSFKEAVQLLLELEEEDRMGDVVDLLRSLKKGS